MELEMLDFISELGIYNYNGEDLTKFAVETKQSILSGTVNNDNSVIILKLKNIPITKEQLKELHQELSNRIERKNICKESNLNLKTEYMREYIFRQQYFDQMTGLQYSVKTYNQSEAQKTAGKDFIIPPCSICVNKRICKHENEYNCQKYFLDPKRTETILNDVI